jgi:rhamnogalacturonyl hydrolase YesR
MFLQSMADGVRNGWLDRSSVGPAITLAWAGLSSTVESTGEVTGICEGTGIGADVAFYQARSTAYPSSAPGLGSVFRAALAYEAFMK